MKRLINYFFLLNVILGGNLNEFPQNSFNLGRWNGGSASTSIYQHLNPASLPLQNVMSISHIKIPENISIQNIFITQNYKFFLIKLNTTILDYGELEDFVTDKKFKAKDLQFELSVKSTFQGILSLGVQLNYNNKIIDNYSFNQLNTKIGFRAHLLENRLGIGLVLNHLLESNNIKNELSALIGAYYKPIYFPGEFSIDVNSGMKNKFILSMLININNFLDVSLGFTNNKFEHHTSSTFENIYSGLGFGFDLKLKKYKIGFGLRNIGQYGTMSGITLGYRF